MNQVTDEDKKVPQYLVLMSEPKDGLPYDYDQVRVFTWNVKRHRYETAYRERNLSGVLPVTVSREDFGKEGVLPVFMLQVKDDNDNLSQRKYKMNTPIVRRVLVPGEEKETSTPEKGKASLRLTSKSQQSRRPRISVPPPLVRETLEARVLHGQRVLILPDLQRHSRDMRNMVADAAEWNSKPRSPIPLVSKKFA